jgi:hypothetical protein
MPGQIVENFRCRRWKSWVGEHTLGDVSRPSGSNRRTFSFRRCEGRHQLRASGALASFNSSSENALCREGLGPCANTAFGIRLESASEDNFVLRSWRIFAADFVVTL